MKTIYKTLMLAVLAAVFATVGAVGTSYAQGDEAALAAEKTALYETYTKNYKGTIDQRRLAVQAAKDYIEKFSGDTAQVDYYKKALPALEKGIADEQKRTDRAKISTRYDSNFNKNFDEVYAAGRDFLAENPNLLEVLIDLGSIGLDETLKPAGSNTKYNSDTINYAKQAIQKIEGGTKTVKGDYNGYFYSYGDEARSKTNPNDKFPGKDNTLGNLNYVIAYLMYFNQNQKKEAIPYFYKATKYDSSVKSKPAIYQLIGDYYFEEAKRLNQESETLAKAAGDKDTDESKAKDAMAKGYADRAIDAYARAYKYASAPTAGVKPEYKNGLYKLLQDLFKFRFNGDVSKLDAYVSTVMNKEFVDPATEVAPAVIEAAPAATTTGTANTSSLSTTSNANVSASAATGSATSKVGTGSTAAKTTTAATAAKAKTPAKKVVKKKGTR